VSQDTQEHAILFLIEAAYLCPRVIKGLKLHVGLMFLTDVNEIAPLCVIEKFVSLYLLNMNVVSVIEVRLQHGTMPI